MFIYTLSDIIGLILFALFLLFLILWFIKDAWIQWRCKHEKFYENMACNAICSKCRKNLGFIGTVREQRNKVVYNK